MLTEFQGFSSLWARFLSPFYEAGVRIYLSYLRTRAPVRAPIPVVSVGNITLGGSGKTPMIRYLADLFFKRGYQPVILCKGYRGRLEGPAPVPREGSPLLYGDEAVMLARAGYRVWISREKRRGVIPASREGDILLLDDGFQNLDIARDLDILMVGNQGVGNLRCFPAGILREPLEGIRRADAICGSVESLLPFEPSIPRFSFTITGYRFFPERPPEGVPFAALAGIAYPSHFFAKLTEFFSPPTLTHAFPDHHPFHPWEIEILKKTWKKRGVAYVVVTPKDAVKLPPHLGIPLFIAEPIYQPRDPYEEQRFRRFLFTRLGL